METYLSQNKISVVTTGLILGLCTMPASPAIAHRLTPQFTNHRSAQINYTRDLMGDLYHERFDRIHSDVQLKRSLIRAVLNKRLPIEFQWQSESLAGVIVAQGVRNEIDPIFILAQIENESQFNPLALGTHGEMGLLQLKPATAEHLAWRTGIKSFVASDLLNPAKNISMGSAYIVFLKSRYNYSKTAFLDAYNIGPARLKRRIDEGNFEPCSYTYRIRETMFGYYRLLERLQSEDRSLVHVEDVSDLLVAN